MNQGFIISYEERLRSALAVNIQYGSMPTAFLGRFGTLNRVLTQKSLLESGFESLRIIGKGIIMRMWMIGPELMCIQHILGEHRELHALKGSLERTKPSYDNHDIHRKNLTTLAKDGIIELKSLKDRHEKLLEYLDSHNSPIGEIPTMKYLSDKVRETGVDREKALQDLIDRPESCRPEGCCRRKIKESGVLDLT